MKENVIFCYSGTGNCLDMAKNIAKSLGDTDIIMMRKYPAVTDVREAKRVGFIFPCYGGGLPGHVERYLHDIKVSPDAYTFAINQSAAYKGEGLKKLNDIGIDIVPYWVNLYYGDTAHYDIVPLIGKYKENKSLIDSGNASLAADAKKEIKRILNQDYDLYKELKK